MTITFKQIETANEGTSFELNAILDHIKFTADGLIPAIAQQADSGEVLMLAWMNRESIIETLTTGHVCYWSRSRQCYWRKGESSGNQQHLREMRLDCDGDALLLKVAQTGPACHTNRRSCFYLKVDASGVTINSDTELC